MLLVSCLSVSIKRQKIQIHVTMKVLNTKLILYSAHSAACRKKRKEKKKKLSSKFEDFVTISHPKAKSLTLTKQLAQKRPRAGRWCWARERESWTSFASVVSQRRNYGHCLCDSVLHSSWDSDCVVRWSLRSAGRTLP